MRSRTVLIFETKEGAWSPFLRDYLAESGAEIKTSSDVLSAASSLDRISPSILFVEPEFLSKTLLQKIKVRYTIDPLFRAYLLGKERDPLGETIFSARFSGTPDVSELNKYFMETLPLPEVIKILVVDDEDEIGAMIREYFEGRRAPAFLVECASQGVRGLEAINREPPDVILLDIKMPVMDGREFYARLKREGLDIPVIVFFDSISGEELAEMREIGDPAVIEKGTRGSSLGALMILVKKIVYFSARR